MRTLSPSSSVVWESLSRVRRLHRGSGTLCGYRGRVLEEGTRNAVVSQEGTRNAVFDDTTSPPTSLLVVAPCLLLRAAAVPPLALCRTIGGWPVRAARACWGKRTAGPRYRALCRRGRRLLREHRRAESLT
eukprot:4012381-Prymnesium_polylepis.1